MSPFPAQDETAKGGFTLPDFRAAMLSAVTTVSNSRVRYVHGPDMMLAANMSDPYHYSIAGDKDAAQKIDAALTAGGTGGGGGGTPPAPTFQTVDAQDFEASSSLPANYNQDTNFVVVSGEASTSGTRSVKLTAQIAGALGDETHSFAEGRFSANIQAVVGSSIIYPNLRFNIANNNQYNMLVAQQADGTQQLYLQKVLNGGQPGNLAQLDIVPKASGFYRYTIERIGATLSVYLQRLSDSKYLTTAADFASTARVACMTYTDNSPLPAGRAKFSAYINVVSAGNACYFDDSVTEIYA